MMNHRPATANRITDITNGVDSAETWDFGYDALSRLVTAQSPATLGGFGYDAIGNRDMVGDRHLFIHRDDAFGAIDGDRRCTRPHQQWCNAQRGQHFATFQIHIVSPLGDNSGCIQNAKPLARHWHSFN